MTEEHTHISDEMWKKYAQGTLSTKEEEKLYTHVGCCTYCAERFANIVETDFFAEPPSYLYDEIVERSRKVDVQAAATMTTTLEQNPLEFSEVQQQENKPSITKKINDNSYKFTGYLQDATNRLLEFKIKEDK